MTALNKSVKEGAPAFPGSGGGQFWAGMTLRDYFAAQAMQAMISTAGAPCLDGLDGYESLTASKAYNIADAMLEARK